MSDMYFQNLPNTSTPITAENLNKLNDIKVSSTQPNTGEKVWFKQGKNLFNKDVSISGYRLGSEGDLFADSSYSASEYIEVKSSTAYVANWNLETRECVCYYTESKTFISRNTSEKAFTTPSNCKWIRISRATSSINATQVEQGTTATSYEPYIEKEIYIKNNNNVYENFINLNKAVQLNGILNNNTDLNNVLTTGIYCTAASTLTNAPVSEYNWAFLVVLNQNAMIHQYFVHPYRGIFYFREYSGNPSRWTSWRLPNQDVALTTATRNSTAFSAGNIKYFKNGKIVTVSIMDLIADSDITTHGTIIASGLPIPIEAVVFCLDRKAPDSSASSNCRVSINTSGNLVLHYDHFYSGEKQYYGQVTYLSS